jgi:hypothetical protein
MERQAGQQPVSLRVGDFASFQKCSGTVGRFPVFTAFGKCASQEKRGSSESAPLHRGLSLQSAILLLALRGGFYLFDTLETILAG